MHSLHLTRNSLILTFALSIIVFMAIFFLLHDYVDISAFTFDEDGIRSRFAEERETDKIGRSNFTNSPVFIVGCGHSGTTLMRVMLGMHRDFCSAPETNVLIDEHWKSGNRHNKKLKIFRKELSAKLLKSIDRSELTNAQYIDSIFSGFCASRKKKRWIEKTPAHVRHMERILLNFPSAVIVYLLRDGRDVACSIEARGETLESGARRWVKDNELGRVYWSNPRVKLVRYDDLVTDTEGVMRNLMRFLQAPWDPRVLKHESEIHSHSSFSTERSNFTTDDHSIKQGTPLDDHRSLRTWQVNQPIFDGRGRWKECLSTPKRKDIVESISGYMLRMFGFTETSKW